MEVLSLCPFRAASLAWQPRRGAWALTVVVKATYDLMPVESPLAREQEYPNEDDNHWNDDAARSIYSPSDLVPFKPRADVMLVGHAFAPRKEAVRSLTVRLIVGDVNKAIEVFGERAWTHDGLLREGPRFIKMPLRYERASGGGETSNPVGMRADNRPDTFGNIQVPNLQPPGLLLADASDFIDPIGFGPIAPSWPGRRDKLGRHVATWQHGRWDQPVPDDIDTGYFMAAPRDQQVEVLRPNERIILENLHPEHPRLVTSLPGVVPQAFVDRRGHTQHELSLTCDTLWIDTDRSVCTVTWRGQLPMEGPGQAGRILIAAGDAGQRLTWADVERLAADAIDLDDADLGTNDDDDDDGPAATTGLTPKPHVSDAPGRKPNATLPFIATPPGFGSAVPVPMPPPSKPKRPPPSPRDETKEEFTDTGFVRPAAALPFNELSSIGATPVPNEPTFGGSNGGLPFAQSDGRAAAYGEHSRVGLPFAPQAEGSRPRANGVDAPNAPNRETDVPPPAADASPPWLAPAPPRTPTGLGPPGLPPPPNPPPLNTSGVFTAPPAQLAQTSADSPWAGSGAPAAFTAGALRGDGGAAPAFGAPATSGGFAAAPPPPPAVVVAAAPPGNVANAATAGVVAASNAAAAASSWITPNDAPAPVVSAPIALRPLARPNQREAIELLWFHKETVERIRENDPWKEVLAALKPKPPEVVPFDAELPPEPTPEQKEKRDVATIMTRATPTDGDGINEAITDAVTEEGLFEPPLILLGGELLLPFDELETLKANVTAVTPLIAGDKRLKETVDNVNELLKTPWLESSTGVAEGLTQKIREAFAQANRILPASYLDTHTERILLEQRNYQKRTMWGELWIRSLMHPYNGSIAVPCYLPDALSKQLPMFQRFKARLICEAVVQQDENEAQPIALKVVALGRIVTVSGVARPRRPSASKLS